MLKLGLIVIGSCLVGSVAGAHPGHGEPGQGFSFSHYLTEPIHILGGFALAFVVLAGVRALRRQRGATR